MKRRYQDGGEIDAMEMANKSDEAMDIADSLKRGAPGTSETVRATPKAVPKAAAKAASKPAPKAESKPKAESSDDVTKMSVAERARMSRERARSGSGPTDRRSVSERIRSAVGMKNGGMTASKRADGIAQRGKTRGKMC